MSQIDLNNFEVWLLTGSQRLYGDQALREVESHARQIASGLEDAPQVPVRVVAKPVLAEAAQIREVVDAASASNACIGVLAWMHTFSPAQMWITGLKRLSKPLLHLHTQYNRELPWATIDMAFMNLNQSAHGDREFGHLAARMKLACKIVVGHWQDHATLDEVGIWIRAAAARHDLAQACVARFGDNMRDVAVTEGDKVNAQEMFGYAVKGFGTGDLVEHIEGVSNEAVAHLVAEYDELYDMAEPLRPGGSKRASLNDAARIELGLRGFLESGQFVAFTDTFENLHGLSQLPGIAVQRLMADGYGFGAEGDWKAAALVRAAKVMAAGLPGGTSLMEDYTYHFTHDQGLVLGSHMLEICPSVAATRPACEIHPLAIGAKDDPVRLVFTASAGPAVNVSIVDMGERFRMVLNEIDVVEPPQPLPRLPTARAVWKPRPDLRTAAAAWILAGGSHHTAFSQALSTPHFEDLAQMWGVEMAVIDDETRLRHFRQELSWNNAGVYRGR